MGKGLLLGLSFVVGLWISVVAEGNNWVLLIASSNSWKNYRHQSDICRSYHIVRKFGVPEDRIVTMMYDDIAYHLQNRYKGVIRNKPEGPNVYPGVKIDYRGADVTPKNFLNVLQGNQKAMTGIGTGRVIKSDSGDNIFVYFVDHGGVGLLCFPNEYLYANQLEAALRDMSNNNKFKKMLLYVEACESGSLFDGIIDENSRIFVTTASAGDESSWGWFCKNELNTCLGDLYSITWMDHVDQLFASGQSETLFHQYSVVRNAVKTSHIQIYGDFRLGFDNIREYIGNGSNTFSSPYRISLHQRPVQVDSNDGVPSKDVPLHLTQMKVKKATDRLGMLRAQQEYTELIQKRAIADQTVAEIVARVAGGDPSKIREIENKSYALNKDVFGCYRNTVEEFNKHCMNTFKNTYLVSHFYKLMNLCSANWTTERYVSEAMASVCNDSHRNMTGID